MTRRRIILLPVLLLVAVLVYLFPPTQLSSLYSFDDWAPLGSPSAQARRAQEIHGLLYFVINRADKILVPLSDLDAPIDPTKPIELRVYGEDGGLESASQKDWMQRANALDRETPLVIFSKSYCPFSRRAKALLASYDLSPPPTIIEVDQRGDGDLIKSILTRLTDRATFPNVILKGNSIGGSDDLAALHQRGKLAPMLRKAGIQIRADPKNLVPPQ
ncbi:unnamed protein product [Peniophora sp. CBMAI 1063]|nr:unnamed protein product [Peniophora sp. CBMAI 1063]